MQDNDKHTVDDGRPEQEPATLGARLRAARESRDLSIEQLAGELRIELRLLLALEGDRFDELGAPVFAKGYLKQYGSRLGLDYGDLLAQYYRQVDDAAAEPVVLPSRPIRLMDNRQVHLWLAAALTAVLLIVLLLIWWLNAPDGELAQANAPQGGEPVVLDSVTPGVEAETGAVEAGPVEAASPASSGLPADADADADADIDLEQGEAAAVSASADPAGHGAGLAAPAPAEADETVSGPGLQIVMLFEQNSWVEATDANGVRLFYGLAEQGARARFSGTPPVSFLLGNADGVRLLVDGQPYPVPDEGRQGNLARFSISD